MIHNYKDLKYYYQRDRSRYRKSRLPLWVRRFIGEEAAIALYYLKILRLLEFFINTTNRKDGGILGSFLWLIHRRQQIKYGIHIPPNKVGPGLKINHIGGGIYLNIEYMGKDCSVNAGVICGNKNNNSNIPVIGDNVQLMVGAKVIGKITIGDNSIIAPNSVVVKDVPPKAIVTGIPAKFLKYNYD